MTCSEIITRVLIFIAAPPTVFEFLDFRARMFMVLILSS
tara:strand:- start:2153 stop:2269 length:117 start_codon:yes stop_codon:yes gene_type:complete